MWPFTNKREEQLKQRAEEKHVSQVVPEIQTGLSEARKPRTPEIWDYSSYNPSTLSLLKAGHSIAIEDRYLIKGNKVSKCIDVVDLENLDIEFAFEGITRDSLSESFIKIKSLTECRTKEIQS